MNMQNNDQTSTSDWPQLPNGLRIQARIDWRIASLAECSKSSMDGPPRNRPGGRYGCST